MSITSPNRHHQLNDSISSSKRKLDDYAPPDDDFSDLISVRMKKSDSSDAAVNSFSSSPPSPDVDQTRVSLSHDRSQSQFMSKSLQFFVRTNTKTLVIHANSDDTVESVHELIRKMTGVPVHEQGLIYRGRQLQWDQTLQECGIQNDAGLQLIGRLRSSYNPLAWQVIDDLVSSIYSLCKGELLPHYRELHFRNVKIRVKEFLKLTPSEDEQHRAAGHFETFNSAGAPSKLVMLLLSPFEGNKECAEEAIRLLLTPNLDILPKTIRVYCVSVVLELCKLLRRAGFRDPLYDACRSTLGCLLDSIGCSHETVYSNYAVYFNYAKPPAIVQELYPFLNEMAIQVKANLESSRNVSTCTGTSLVKDVSDFTSFMHVVCMAIKDHVGGERKLPLTLDDKHPSYLVEIKSLHDISGVLLDSVNECLVKVDGILISKGAAGESESLRLGWYQYIPILKELNSVFRFYNGGVDRVSSVMQSRRLSLNVLIRHLKRSERSDEHHWLLDHKDVTDFESRRHLVMMMFPEMVDDFEEVHEMLIDRSHLLEESFEYIGRADPKSFHGGLFMEFKNEEATGPGVLREWFFLVCQAIFNPQNPLFLACPNDRRRFFPNSASKVDSLHLDYFGFCGRMIALALMNKVHVGIVLDRAFFLQLAGKSVSLEDVRDADPCMYTSCKKILEMDADVLDSDALGLTFVQEIEELGSRKVVELCCGGNDIVVDSKNREDYVKLLIQHRFVTSISEQVARFAQGFADVLCNSEIQQLFFRSLELEDLDRMLCGSDNAICVKDWKAHTDYSGYKASDRQICWFWKVVERMSTEQQRVLLFFWTSVKYLPVEGFGGLASRLQICKSSDSYDRLPSSHTCFYKLCVPPYQSEAAMRASLQLITQEHVSCSFGTW